MKPSFSHDSLGKVMVGPFDMKHSMNKLDVSVAWVAAAGGKKSTNYISEIKSRNNV